MLVLFAGLLVKAAQLQLFDNSYKARANAIAVDKITQYPSRGLIYDRNMKLLVNNNPMYDLMVTYNQVNSEMDTTLFCELLNISKEKFIKNLNKDFRGVKFSKSIPFVFLKKISTETYARFQEHLYEFPGFFVQIRNVRGYPHENAPHVLGYISEVNKSQIEKSEGGYELGDYIGASGLELSYEKELRGKKGRKYSLKDNLGRVVGAYKNGAIDTAAISGKDLITSIDLDLQQYAEQLMQNKRGSVVAIEPQTGEILAILSSPGYDPNLLVINRNRGAALQDLLGDTLNRPFFDRTVMAKYPPGSIFKTLVGLVGMQEGTWRANKSVSCDGAYHYNNISVGCRNHPRARNIGIGLQYSCNSYFIQCLRSIIDKESFYKPDVGLDIFVDYLYKFGLGKKLNTDLPYELTGNIPNVSYYDFLYPKSKGGWKSPTIMSIGIGQGEIEMTTLQIANLAAIIANKGYYYTPHLGKGFRYNTAEIDPKYKIKNEVGVDEVYFESVIDGMRRVVDAGTARVAKIPGIDLCGKTGTSQNAGEDHSVFFGFAPAENPKIAIAVYVENAKYSFAAPIASLITEKYLRGNIVDWRISLEERLTNANLLDTP